MKYLDLTEFRDSGLLQEVNRLFFHPRGLALAVDVADRDGKLMALGIFGIQDFRDDPEGVWMTLDEADVARGLALTEDFGRRAVERAGRLGFVFQPLVVQGKEHPRKT